MKNLCKLLIVFILLIVFPPNLLGQEELKGEVNALWKKSFVEDSKDYNEIILMAEKVIARAKSGSAEYLTAGLLKAFAAKDKARENLESPEINNSMFAKLASECPSSWQSQVAKIQLIHNCFLNGKNEETVQEAKNGLNDINWAVLGDKAPSDLMEYKNQTEELTVSFSRDALRMIIASCYASMENGGECKHWIAQIENEKFRSEMGKHIKPLSEKMKERGIDKKK